MTDARAYPTIETRKEAMMASLKYCPELMMTRTEMAMRLAAIKTISRLGSRLQSQTSMLSALASAMSTSFRASFALTSGLSSASIASRSLAPIRLLLAACFSLALASSAARRFTPASSGWSGSSFCRSSSQASKSPKSMFAFAALKTAFSCLGHKSMAMLALSRASLALSSSRRTAARFEATSATIFVAAAEALSWLRPSVSGALIGASGKISSALL
mmetsp:Transcript_4464/g.7120  ORF Transcript_4464/g.7120 Transcript_4464/m.7120 type:complete len:217 (-) Transcript_4464:637-1287(-)